MNKQQTALKVRDTMRKYKEQGSDSPCRKNHIVLFSNNTFTHEISKCEICYGLLQGALPQHFDYKLNHLVFKQSPDFKKLSFITEAVDRKTGKRRDVVILETGQIIEVVNTHESKELLDSYKKDDVLIIKV